MDKVLNDGRDLPDVEGIIEELRSNTPFDLIDREHLRWMALRFSTGYFPQGTPVLVPGQVPDKCYFIRRGGVQLEAMGKIVDEKKVLAEIGQGECFPLEALYEKRPVFSTFRTNSDTEYYVLQLEDYLVFEEMSPVFRDFCQHRADGFLESSRKIYHSHYATTGSEQFTLDSPLSLLVRSKPVAFAPDAQMKDVLSTMASEGLNIVVIVNPESEPLGIFTTEDLLEKVASGKLDTNASVSSVMGPVPALLSPQNYGHEAALQMAMHGYKQILVTENRKLIGVVTERDLFSLQRVGLSEISNMIRRAISPDVLSNIAQDIQLLAGNMLAQGVHAEQLTRIISTLNDHLTCRVLHLEFGREDMELPGFCWIALGSEGRFEQTFYSDQDNGIIFETPAGKTPDEIRAILVPIAQRINRVLGDCGFPLCKGDVMAGNPQWCLSHAEWKKKFSQWIDEPSPEALLNATIFFDFRPLYGQRQLGDDLITWLAGAAKKNSRFIHLMVENALERSAPVGFFNNFVVDKDRDYPNTIDLKLSGAALFVDSARIFSLANGLPYSNTAQRLRAAAEAGKIQADEVGAWIDSFYFIQTLRLRQQLEQNMSGKQTHNRVNPDTLNDLDRRIFLESLRQAGKLQKALSSLYRIRGM
ncbi:MAG: DUF294 nucleotidyltransferase-like domain-containing protein [Thermodesulfovibrionales bacterium]